MKISSYNEWDSIESIVVGSAVNANWPVGDTVFRAEAETTAWRKTPLPSGPVPAYIIEETEEDLAALSKVLEQAGAEVHRPEPIDFVAQDGMYNYCPRDRVLIAGDQVVDVAMKYPCRNQEIGALQHLFADAHVLEMPKTDNFVLDAANICRLGNTWLYLESSSGNRAAAVWLQAQFPEINIEVVNFYAGVHIDSTIAPVREGLVVLNASRVNEANCPKIFQDWDKIWIDDCVPQEFYQYPYASKWIGLNMLSINPDTVIVDASQTHIHRELEKRGVDVVPLTLRHSRTLGGGFHCVTLDLRRKHEQ